MSRFSWHFEALKHTIRFN